MHDCVDSVISVKPIMTLSNCIKLGCALVSELSENCDILIL